MVALEKNDEITAEATIITEIDDVPEWSWEMTAHGATIRLSVTDDGAVCVAIERDVLDQETGTTRLSNSAYYMDGEQAQAFAWAVDVAESHAAVNRS